MAVASSRSAGPSILRAGLALARAPDIVWGGALFLATLSIMCRTIGTSPRIWEDTLIENLVVRDCLTGDQCTAVGVGSTFGIFHSAGYLHWRALLQAIGLHGRGTFLAILTMNALGVVLVAVAARRLGGRLEAAISALLVLASIGVPTQLDVITDLAPMPALGAVFLLLAVSSIERPGLGVTALLAVVGGVAVNFYATGALLGVSAVWVALLQPRRRWVHALVAAVVFAWSAFAISPLTWIVDFDMVRSMHRLGNGQAVVHHAFFDVPMARLTALALALWLAAVVARSPLRRALAVPAAITVPLFVPFAIGAWTGHIDPQDKYFSHVIGAVSVTLAVGCAALLRRFGSEVARRVTLLRWLADDLDLDALAPYAAVLVIAVGLLSPVRPIRPSNFNLDDLEATARTLGSERGWSLADVSVNLKTPQETVRRALLYWTAEWPATGAAKALQRAWLVKVPAGVPVPATDGMVAVTPSHGGTMILALGCSWIDWRSFRACTRREGQTDETCTATGIPAYTDGWMEYHAGVPGLPQPGLDGVPRQALTLRLPLHPSAECPDERVVMPELNLVCRGRIVAVDGETSPIDADGSRVDLHYDPSAPGLAPHELAITWALGVPECWNTYGGVPPFFLEGDPRIVEVLHHTLTAARPPGPQ